jgi:ubiquinone/menaquinone biosynthesis C-methylase UbiE
MSDRDWKLARLPSKVVPMSSSTLHDLPKPSLPSSSSDAHAYVLGTGIDEAQRLGLQHRLWSSHTHRLWELAGIQPGNIVIDLGCGPGHAAIDLAQIVGQSGRVIAVDESAAFLKQLRDHASSRGLENINRVLGDVQELDECIEGGVGENKQGTVDVAYARWTFCFVNSPEAVVRSLAPIMKVGGKLVVQDYFNYERCMTLAPRREPFTKVINAVAASWRSRGGDTDVMGKLPSILHKNGFDVTHLDVVQRIARPGTTLWHWPTSFFANFVPKLIETGFITMEDAHKFFVAWEEASKDPGSFIQLPPVYELIAVKR